MKRKTSQRAAIEQVFCERDRPLGIEEILESGRLLVESLNQATVYRNLNHLCGHGLIRRVGPVNGQERYDGTLSPHSHFICNRCGAILDLPQRSPGQGWLDSVGVPYGFQVESCEFIVRGLCRGCASTQPDGQN